MATMVFAGHLVAAGDVRRPRSAPRRRRCPPWIPSIRAPLAGPCRRRSSLETLDHLVPSPPAIEDRRHRKPARRCPWILCGPGAPPESNRRAGRLDRDSSAPTAFPFAFSTWPTPLMVPPVGRRPEITASTAPPVVVPRSPRRSRTSGGSADWPGFSNCCGITAPLISASSFAGPWPPPRPCRASRGAGSVRVWRPAGSAICAASIDIALGHHQDQLQPPWRAGHERPGRWPVFGRWLGSTMVRARA